MPATTTQNFTAQPTRECPHPAHEGERVLPFDSEHFYIRPNGAADYWCRACVRRYNREQRRNRPRADLARKFGVEMEVVGVDRYDLERELRSRGLDVYNANYTHAVMSSWKIVTDASVAGGYELVSPPLSGRDGLDQLKKACQALTAAGARVNQSCGLHVHHDVSDLNPRQFGRLFRAWANNQRNTDGLVAPSRRGSRWAQPLRADELRLLETLPSVDRVTANRHLGYIDRYRSLNSQAFGRYGTVEVRQHQGTINFKKIAAWIAYGQAFVKLAKGTNSVDSQLTTDALLDHLAGHGLSAGQVAFLKDRAAHFAGRLVAA
jgi:hypothetical protein